MRTTVLESFYCFPLRDLAKQLCGGPHCIAGRASPGVSIGKVTSL
jgi:hypothetical protein